MEASVCWGIGLQCAEVVGCWAGRVLGVDGGELWDWSFRALCVHSRAGRVQGCKRLGLQGAGRGAYRELGVREIGSLGGGM